MIGIVGKLLDTAEARRETENLQHNYAQLLQEYAAAKGTIKSLEWDRNRLDADNQRLRAENAALTESANGDTRRLLVSLKHERSQKEKAVSRVFDLQKERDEAVTGRQVAERALDAARIPQAGDSWKRQAEQDRANAERQADLIDEMQRALEAFERDIAELRGRLAECEREHP